LRRRGKIGVAHINVVREDSEQPGVQAFELFADTIACLQTIDFASTAASDNE